MSPKARATYFCEHNFAELLRGDLKARYDAYAVGRQWGWLSANDVLELENRNPREDPGGDEYLEPMNMVANGVDGKTPNAPAPDPVPAAPTDPGPDDDEGDNESQMRSIARRALSPVFLDAAERAAKKELEGIRRIIKRATSNAEIVDGISQFVGEYRDTVERIIGPAALAYAQARGRNGHSTAIAATAARETSIEYGKSALRRLRDTITDSAGREIVLGSWTEERARELADAIADQVEKEIIREAGEHGAQK